MSEKGLSDANDDIEDLVVLGLWFWKPIGLKSTLIHVIAGKLTSSPFTVVLEELRQT